MRPAALKLVARQTPHDEAIFAAAAAAGCVPLWADGIIGWAWHCTCPDNPHGADQQCSALTQASIRRPLPFCSDGDMQK